MSFAFWTSLERQPEPLPDTGIRMVTTVALQLLLIFCVVVFPASVLFINGFVKAHATLSMGAMMLVLFNVPTAVAAFAFVLALLIVLVHRITWPLLSSWTYILTRKEVLEKRNALRFVGSTLLLFGLSGIPQLAFVLKILEQFHK